MLPYSRGVYCYDLSIFTDLPPSSRTFMFSYKYACVFPHSCTHFCLFIYICFPHSYTYISLFICVHIMIHKCIYFAVPRHAALFMYKHICIFTRLYLTIQIFSYFIFSYKYKHIHIYMHLFSFSTQLSLSIHTHVYLQMHTHLSP